MLSQSGRAGCRCRGERGCAASGYSDLCMERWGLLEAVEVIGNDLISH